MSEARFLADILVARGVLDELRKDALVEANVGNGGDFLETLVTNQVVDEVEVAKALAAEACVDCVETIDHAAIATELATQVPISFAKQHHLLAAREDERAVYVLCADPFNTTAVDEVRMVYGKPIEVVVAGAERITDSVSKHLGVATGTTSDDLEHTLEAVACVGCCSLAPVMTVNEETHGRLDPQRAVALLAVASFGEDP